MSQTIKNKQYFECISKRKKKNREQYERLYIKSQSPS